MFDKIYSKNVNLDNAADVYKALSVLTLNRDENRGTLEVKLNGGSVELKCANHHFLSSRNKFQDFSGTNAAALRELVTKAVAGELDTVFAHLMDKASKADQEEVEAKCQALKAQFLNDITWNDGLGHSESLSRKAIGAILQNVEAIKKNLSVSSLLGMSAEELAALAGDGANDAGVGKVKSFNRKEAAEKDLVRSFRAQLDSFSSVEHCFESYKGVVLKLFSRAKEDNENTNPGNPKEKFISDYNAALVECGVKELFVDMDGNVALRPPEEGVGERARAENVKSDFQKLLNIVSDHIKGPNARIIGFRDSDRPNDFAELFLNNTAVMLRKTVGPSGKGEDEEINRAFRDFKARLDKCTTADRVFEVGKDIVSHVYAMTKRNVGSKRYPRFSESDNPGLSSPVSDYVAKMQRAVLLAENFKDGYSGTTLREVEHFLKTRVDEGSIGLTDELKKKLNECVADIEGLAKKGVTNIGAFSSLTKMKISQEEKDALLNDIGVFCNKLTSALNEYIDRLINKLPEAFNSKLQELGITEVHVDTNGTVELKPRKDADDEGLRAKRVKADFERLASLLVNSDTDKRASGVGIPKEAFKGMAKYLDALSQKLDQPYRDANQQAG